MLEGGLRAVLEEHGALHVTGSCALELMAWRDLDLHVALPRQDVAEWFALGRQVALLLRPWKMHFHDNRARQDAGSPAGLCWGVRLGDIRAGAWKLDIWGFDAATCAAREARQARLGARLTPETREAILRIKTELWTRPAYRDTIASQHIDDAVLDGGVRDLPGFWARVGPR
jgi:hypothetical protein